MSVALASLRPRFNTPSSAIEMRQSPHAVKIGVPIIALNQNVNPVTDAHREKAWLSGQFERPIVSTNVSEYPPEQSDKLIKAMAGSYGVSEDTICITRGGDGAIEILTEIFCVAGDSILVSKPTFFSYEDYATKRDVKTIDVPLQENGMRYELNSEGILKKVQESKRPGHKENIKLVYICSPNNPTGTAFPEDQIVKLVRDLEKEGVVCVVDEAYIKIANKPSMSRRLSELENLITIHTASKELSAAGLRVGAYCCNDPKVVRAGREIPSFYNVSSPSLELALNYYDSTWNKINEESYADIRNMRAEQVDRLIELDGINIFEADDHAANFFLMKIQNMDAYLRGMAEHGIRVGNPAFFDFNDRVRVSIGLEEENQKFFDATAQTLEALRR